MSIQEIVEDVYVYRSGFPSEVVNSTSELSQSAMTIMDYNGRVVAMVGGAGEKQSFRGLNRACNSPRQPGSSIKPLSVYAPALDMGIIKDGNTVVLDKAIMQFCFILLIFCCLSTLFYIFAQKSL